MFSASNYVSDDIFLRLGRAKKLRAYKNFKFETYDFFNPFFEQTANL